MKKYKEKFEEFAEKFDDFADEHPVIASFSMVTVCVFLFMVTVVVGLGVSGILWSLMGLYSLFIIIPVVIGAIVGFLVWQDEL